MPFDFQRMINSCFRTFDVLAKYYPLAGPPKDIVVIKIDPETDAALLSQQFRLSPDRQAVARLVDVRKTDVSTPQRGDTIVIDGASYKVGNVPDADEETLVWTLPLTKV